MVKPLAFTATDHVRVNDAIRQAEAATSGEIFAVFARTSDRYLLISVAFALALSLLTGLLAALAAALFDIPVSPVGLQIAQLLGALGLVGLLQLSTTLRLMLVPRRIQAERAHRLALAQFMAHNIHATEARTGVLLFVSEAERHAEVVADAGINAKVPQSEWDAIVAMLTEAAKDDRLADGFVEGIAAAGRLLADHFPPSARNPNEIPDQIVEL